MRNSNLAYRLVFLVLFVVPSLGLAVPAQDTRSAEDSRKAVLDLEKHWLHSEANPDAIEKIVADDVVHVLSLGFINKQQQMRIYGAVRRIQQSSVLALRFTEKFDADLSFDGRCPMLTA
jgi:hypothetical protein